MHQITDWLNDLSGTPAYGAVALLVFCEVAVPFGFLLPGETSVILGGVLAHRAHTSLAIVAAVAVAAAIAGDSTGYLIGRLTGTRLRADRPADRLRRAEELMDRRGPAAVFFGRFLPFVRSAIPLLAGAGRMPYPRFLLFDALAALLWGTGSALTGYAVGAAWNRFVHALGGSLLVLAAAAAVTVLTIHLRRRHHRRTPPPPPTPPPQHPPPTQHPPH